LGGGDVRLGSSCGKQDLRLLKGAAREGPVLGEHWQRARSDSKREVVGGGEVVLNGDRGTLREVRNVPVWQEHAAHTATMHWCGQQW
jgi:hypothetical protein